MTAGHLSRVEGSTLDAVMGHLARVEATTPPVWMGYLSRVEATVPTAVVANAGEDGTNLEPWDLYSLTGTATGGTVSVHSWRQVSGPAAVLTNTNQATATFKAPGTIAGTTVVFGYTATGTNGTPSLEDTVSFSILPVTERAVIGGVEVPMELRLASSSD